MTKQCPKGDDQPLRALKAVVVACAEPHLAEDAPEETPSDGDVIGAVAVDVGTKRQTVINRSSNPEGPRESLLDPHELETHVGRLSENAISGELFQVVGTDVRITKSRRKVKRVLAYDALDARPRGKDEALTPVERNVGGYST